MTSSTGLRRPGDTALLRHANTRALLLQCAIRVAAEHGIGDASIPRVIAMAQVPAAAFRSHFGTDDELWQTLADGLSNELILILESTAADFVDPAKRIACGVRIYLHLARDCQVFAKVVAHRGLDVAGAASLIHNYLPAYIASGNHSARFPDATVETAIDLIAGTTLAAVMRIAGGGAPADHPERVALAILKGLGVPGPQAQRLVKIELSPFEPATGSMLALARSMPA
jgi:AcrR family transcriptional regulator